MNDTLPPAARRRLRPTSDCALARSAVTFARASACLLLAWPACTAATGDEAESSESALSARTLTVTNPGTQTAGVAFRATVTSSYPLDVAKLQETDNSSGPEFAPIPAGYTLSADRLMLTFPLRNGTLAPHPLQVRDLSYSPILLSNLVTYDVQSAGGGGGGGGDGGTAPRCSTAAWDPSSWEGRPWKLSNDDRTAVSPDDDAEGSINVNFGKPEIPDHQRTYFEVTVAGAALYTAFVVGFGVHGANLSNVNYCAEGQTIANATSVLLGYNDGIAISGYTIYDPGDDGDRCNKTVPPPNTWHDGDVIGVLVDRVDDKFSFTRNGKPQGGTFSMPGIAGKAFYPLVSSWYKSGPVATINGSASPPAGYVSLDRASCE